MKSFRRLPRARRRGLTLLEVSIVIVLIGIVATLAVPNVLAARSQAEQAQLHQLVEAVRKGWVELLAAGRHTITDPALQDTHSGRRMAGGGRPQLPAPGPLAPYISQLGQGTKTIAVMKTDASGAPVPIRDGNGRPIGVATESVEIPTLRGPRGITVETSVLQSTTTGARGSAAYLLSSQLDLPEYSVEIGLNAGSSAALELLRGLEPRLREEGFKTDLSVSRSGSSGHLFLYFVP